ncbi:MAG: transcriptional antiterminator, BglG family [Herbinix sp.]|jgi:beta-glucoside operon transcriptional antiterminator|nr:transcriptional antiterminator, BglG family [Herbinix sp.]
MQIERIINNNVVSAIDPKGKEVIVMGKGIGFHAKQGKEIDQTLIEKIFYLGSQTAVDKFKELIENLPLEHIKVSSDIITYANKVLNRKLNPNIYITLTDHINFAIERFLQGMMFDNPLIWDVQRLYRQEYLIGEYSVALIDQKIGVKLPVDEAASIALHIVNAEYNTVMSETMNITKMLPNILQVVKEEYGITLVEQSLHYERFVSHLKLLVQRVIKREQLDNIDLEFCTMVQNMYPKEFTCSEKIAEYLKEHFQERIVAEELAMMTIHIRRIVLASQTKK